MFHRWIVGASVTDQNAIPWRFPVGTLPDRAAARLWVRAHAEALWIVGILVVAALAHGINMLHFPYYETDEGTYMAQAWAIVHQGQLAPYTYWYDHAPLGWIQIAIWSIFTGGFYTFGTPVDSGRVLMFLMQLASTLMVYRIGRKVSGSVLAASIAALSFALSAYGLYYHRRVLLDNICAFWMLLSILAVADERVSLKQVWLSGMALGISILSKELTAFLVPVTAYLVYDRANRSQRGFATLGWLALVGSIVSAYFLMAILRGELFPAGTVLGGTTPHVSLLGSLQMQAARGTDGGLFDLHSGFWSNVYQWAQAEPFLVVVGGISAILSCFAIRRNRLMALLGVATLSLVAFLARGGIVIGFYLVPLLPLLALNAGLVINAIVRPVVLLLKRWGRTGIALGRACQILVGAGCLAMLLPGYNNAQLGFQSDHFVLWNNDQADAQQQSAQWVLQHIPPNSPIIIDDYMWIDLHDPATGAKGFPYAEWHWKVDLDPAIQKGVFHNNWRTADYVVTTPQMLSDMHVGDLKLVTAAVQHSTVIAHFDTGGWPIDVRRVNKGG